MTNFYVSATGSDAADGLSGRTAMTCWTKGADGIWTNPTCIR